MAYKLEGFVDVRIARIFNTFGPRMHPDDGRVVSNFITQALNGIPLTVYGEGKQTRSFQFVTDLVRGLIALMASEYSMPVRVAGVRRAQQVAFPPSALMCSLRLLCPRWPTALRVDVWAARH